MAIIEIKAFDWRFTDQEKNDRLIAAVTDAFVEVYGEEHRAETWVLLSGVAAGNWGFGGKVRG